MVPMNQILHGYPFIFFGGEELGEGWFFLVWLVEPSWEKGVSNDTISVFANAMIFPPLEL